MVKTRDVLIGVGVAAGAGFLLYYLLTRGAAAAPTRVLTLSASCDGDCISGAQSLSVVGSLKAALAWQAKESMCETKPLAKSWEALRPILEVTMRLLPRCRR